MLWSKIQKHKHYIGNTMSMVFINVSKMKYHIAPRMMTLKVTTSCYHNPGISNLIVLLLHSHSFDTKKKMLNNKESETLDC